MGKGAMSEKDPPLQDVFTTFVRPENIAARKSSDLFTFSLWIRREEKTLNQMEKRVDWR